MNKSLILQALTRLGNLALKQDMEIELSIYGGVAMMLAFNRRSITKDVDAIFHPVQAIQKVANQVAEELDLPEDWLNDDVKQFLAPKGSLRALPQEFPGLKITVPTASYLLAMKALASRRALPGYAGDAEDLRFLIRKMDIRSLAEIQEHIDRYYPDDVLTPHARALLSQLIKETWPTDTQPDVLKP